jgi:ubiquinone/menaquinone biosynthesis C-methylase UbiE
MARKVPNPIAFVKRGYDQIAATYHAQRNRLDNRDLLEEFVRLLTPRRRVLDIGCGAGVPVMQFLVEAACTVTGIDISRAMLALARTNVPDAQVLEMNMTYLAFQAQSFDGLTAFYTIFHVPRAYHRQVFAEFARVLKPGGVMLISLGWSDWEGTEEFHGTEMYWSHYPAETSVSLVAQAGFTPLRSEPRYPGDGIHCWVLARKTQI